MKKTYRFLLPSLLACVLFSCAYENEPYANPDEISPLVINARIPSAGGTRAVTNPPDTADGWSYRDFNSGDAMGFFSSGGKFTDGSVGDAPFVNQKLIYTGGTGGNNFRDPDNTQFSPSHMDGNKIFMYFPYSEDITGQEGFNLRKIVKSPNGLQKDTARCIDFLSTDHMDVMSENAGNSAALYGEFKHTFAELIIMRGEGFDNPPDLGGKEWTIKAVLNTPVTGLRTALNEEGQPWSCTPELVWDSINYPNRLDAQTWDAWLGGNFYKTETDEIGQNAWYVIVPTIGCQANVGEKRPGPRTIVQYVELYDNDGNLQRVSSLRLSNGNSKYVDGGWRYPFEISMQELVPTANPCVIVPWGQDVDLTDERTRGINNATEFENWIHSYNLYLAEPNEQNKNTLLQYGDLYVSDDGTMYWHFYVLSDLNLSNYNVGNGPVIPVLRDILDGQNTTLTNGKFGNYKITGLSSTLVGTLSGPNAEIQNFDIISPDIQYADTNTTPVGTIANTMNEGASVVNCNIRRGTLYNPGGRAGMVVGSMTDALVKDCTLSGFLITTGTANRVAGETTVASNFENNNVDNVTVND